MAESCHRVAKIPETFILWRVVKLTGSLSIYIVRGITGNVTKIFGKSSGG